MKPHELRFQSPDGTVNQGCKWDADAPEAVKQIVNGTIEHAMRYLMNRKTAGV